MKFKLRAGSGVASPTIYPRYVNLQLLSLFIYLEFIFIYSNEHENIRIVGINRQAGHATASRRMLATVVDCKL